MITWPQAASAFHRAEPDEPGLGVTIPIPGGYECNDDDQQGCWVKIKYQFTGGISDTTSWNAFLLGDPVRLVR